MAGKGLADGREQRGYVWLAGQLREAISAGKIAAGASLPGTRQLGAEHGVSAETARWAVKELEAEGLVVSEPRKGYRVQARANDPARGLPVAFVISAAEEPGLWNELQRLLFAGLQQAVAARGWSLLAVGTGRRPVREVCEQLRDCRACGLIVDTVNPELIAAIGPMGLAVVMMDAWDPDMALDAVVQDSFQGALLAVRHLIGRGHRRIGWLGPELADVLMQERYGGACAALDAAGLKADPRLFVKASQEDRADAARRLLARKDRPTAVLGLWHWAAQELVRAARAEGLEPGRDIDIVGWTPEEEHGSTYRALFDGGPVPPAVVWSVAALAEAAVARLAERRGKPGLAPALIKVPARMKVT